MPPTPRDPTAEMEEASAHDIPSAQKQFTYYVKKWSENFLFKITKNKNFEQKKLWEKTQKTSKKIIQNLKSRRPKDTLISPKKCNKGLLLFQFFNSIYFLSLDEEYRHLDRKHEDRKCDKGKEFLYLTSDVGNTAEQARLPILEYMRFL